MPNSNKLMRWSNKPGVPECPEWISEIVWDVHEFVQEPKNMEQFHKEIIEWSKEDTYDHEDNFADIGLLNAEWPLYPKEKFVVLSVIHDSCCDQDNWVSPWIDKDKESDEGERYFHLKSFVPGMMWPKEYKRLLNEYLRVIKSELQAGQNKIEYSLPLPMRRWAYIFGVSENKMKEIREAGDKYHFDKVSDRKWRLPKNELPAEYLEKYRTVTRSNPQ